MAADPGLRRAELVADVEALRHRLTSWKRRARWIEAAGGGASAIVAAVLFRVGWTGGIFGRFFGVTSWLLTLLVGLVALAAARGVIATIAARRLVPARRELVVAESRLRAHDVAFGRHD